MKTRTYYNYDDLKNVEWKKAVVVFDPKTYIHEYSEEQRSYIFSKDNHYFKGDATFKSDYFPELNGPLTSLYGDCLDGCDDHVDLASYIGKWIIERIYIVE